MKWSHYIEENVLHICGCKLHILAFCRPHIHFECFCRFVLKTTSNVRQGAWSLFVLEKLGAFLAIVLHCVLNCAGRSPARRIWATARAPITETPLYCDRFCSLTRFILLDSVLTSPERLQTGKAAALDYDDG